MSTRKLSNITIAQYREFLKKAGCEFVRTNAGHEVWARKDMSRPIVFQTHIEPVPEFIIKNALKAMELSKKDFWQILES
ncbi:MAG: type II toxin-antitoxin system HicA family toxin [Bacteroidota bacterium]